MYAFRYFLSAIFLCSAMVFITACQQSESKASFSEQYAPEASHDAQQSEAASAPFEPADKRSDWEPETSLFSSRAARMLDYEFGKRWVRRANMEFEVNNAVDATLRIEDIVAQKGGFVTNSQVAATNLWKEIQPFRADSAHETRHFQLEGTLSIRVPCAALDATLREIGRLAVFLDKRWVSTEDVELQLLEQSLATLREQQFQANLNAETPNKAAPKAERARNSQEMADQARLNALKLEDDIRFSTVSIRIYQPPQVLRMVVAQENPAATAPPFAWRLGEAVGVGGAFFVSIVLGIIQLWGFLLLGLLVFLGWKWWQSRRVKMSTLTQKSA